MSPAGARVGGRQGGSGRRQARAGGRPRVRGWERRRLVFRGFASRGRGGVL